MVGPKKDRDYAPSADSRTEVERRLQHLAVETTVVARTEKGENHATAGPGRLHVDVEA